MAYPTSLDTFPATGSLASTTLSTSPHSKLHGDLGTAVAAIEAKVGVNSSASSTSLDYIVSTMRAGLPYNVQLGIPAAGIGSVLPANSAATNTTNLQAMLNLGAFGGQSLVFPPGTYQLNGITLAYSGQRLYGFDNVSSVLEYHGTGAGNAFISMTGPADSFPGRTNNSGLEDLTVQNAGTGDSIGLKIINGTHHRFNRVRFEDWHRNAIYASNFADSQFYSCEFEGCGSMDDSNKAVVDFNGTQTAWAVDQVKFIAARFEGNGDQIFKAVNGSGVYVNKIYFMGCKFESGGNMGGTESQFHLENANAINFSDCDWTLQNMRAAHATVPALILMAGTSGCQITNSKFNLGGGGTKLFTYIVDIQSANSILQMGNLLVDSENASNFPTNVVRAQNTPTAFFNACGYSGGQRASGPTWLTGAIHASGAGSGVVPYP